MNAGRVVGIADLTCRTNPKHGRAYDVGERLWCPHHDHDAPTGGTPWLDQQRAPEHAAAR